MTATKTELQDHLKGIDEQRQPLNVELKKIQENERNFSGIQDQMTKNKTSLEHVNREIGILKGSLKNEELTEKSVEEIEEMKGKLAQEERQLNREKLKLTQDLKRAQDQVEREKNIVDQVTRKLDECKFQKKAHEKNEKDLESTLKHVAQELEWEIDVNDEKVIKEAEENLEDTKIHFESEKNELLNKFENDLENQQKLINSLEIEKGQLEQKRTLITQGKIQKNKELALTKRQLSELDGFSSKVEKLCKLLADKDAKLGKMKSETDIGELSGEIQTKAGKVSNLDKDVKSLRNELSTLASQREISSQLNMKKKDLEDKKKGLKRIFGKCEEDLEIIFDNSKPHLNDLKRSFNQKDEQLSGRKMELEQKILRSKTKMESDKESADRLTEEVKNGEKRIEKFEKELGNFNSIDSFDSDLESAKSNVNEIRDELQVREANKHTFKQFVEKLTKSISNSEPCCPTCNRNFASQSECEEVISHLKEEIERVPSRVKFIQKRLDEALDRQSKLEKLYPEKMNCLQIRNSLEAKSQQIEKMEESIKNLSIELQKHESELEEIVTKVSSCSGIREDVLQLDNLNKEIKNLEQIVSDLQSKCNFGTDQRDYDQVKNEEELKTQELDNLREVLEALRSKKVDYESKMNQLQSERNSIFNEKLQLEAQQQDRANAEEKKKQLESQISEDDLQIHAVNVQLSPLDGKINEAKRKKDSILNNKETQIRRLSDKIETIRDMQKNFEAINTKIKDYKLSQNEDNLISYGDELKKARENLAEVTQKQDDFSSEINQIEKKFNSRETRKRLLEDNLRLKDYLSKALTFESEISTLKTQLKNLDFDKVAADKRKLLEHLDQLDRERSENTGRLRELQGRIEDLEEELNDDRLKLAQQRHKQKLIEKVTREGAVKDLNYFFVVLDASIMKFHKERMKVINKIIKELWRATYKGNDIDYIEIQTEDEKTKTVQGADKRRTYNYRVVMKKNDADLEMRGRCSAGQKVLASLIIRLALAETFSTNCGMIALDEPTTNLDRENIESLANALSDLVASRANSNFQLIVITHDEDLLDSLGKVDQISHYFKISRNSMGYSTISKIAMSDR